jgi:hypothetical protein
MPRKISALYEYVAPWRNVAKLPSAAFCWLAAPALISTGPGLIESDCVALAVADDYTNMASPSPSVITDTAPPKSVT